MGTPKGARVISKPLSRNDQEVKKQSTPKITKISYSEITKRPASKNAALQTKAIKAQRVIKKVRKSSKKEAKNDKKRTSGHAASPETIVIKRKTVTKTPKKTPSKKKAKTPRFVAK